MTRPVNLYLLSRIPGKAAFNSVFQHVSEKTSAGLTPVHEIESLRIFADGMVAEGIPVDGLDGFFFGYKIPQIGKEFDLLKFAGGGCLSIELKSQPVPLAQIQAQLIRNRHYLGHLGMDMHLFTFVADTRECYRLDGEALAPVDAAAIAKAVRSFAGLQGETYLTEIDGLFKPSEYIVSPAGTPEKFLAREYFLTQAQDQIQKHLLATLGETTGLAFVSLTGKPGTGKTLLLYDVGRALGAQARTAILHWGALAEGHEIINAANIGLTILPWDVLEADAAGGPVQPLLAAYSYILVDEAHRLSPQQFRTIVETARAYHQRVVFCLDPEQILTTAERRNDIAARIAALPPIDAFTLSERLRGNRQLQEFISAIRDLNHKPQAHMDYRDVDLCFAGSIEEARNQIAYYRARGYVFINYYRKTASVAATTEIDPHTVGAPAASATSGTPADAPAASATSGTPADAPAATDNNVPSPDISSANPFAQFEGGYDIHHAIGQEFDRVVLLLDSSFYYTDEGKLEGVPSPDPDILYPNLFYQSITRVQEKLALIVLENEPLFDAITQIVG